MTSEIFLEKLNEIQKMKCETRTLELKSAHIACPKRLYDTLSSFSNQDDGGIIIFGIDEQNDYEEVGVYDTQDIQKKIGEQCLQMEPVVRPLITVVEKDDKWFVAAEIPGIDISERPCYYKGSGKIKGSFVRVGDSDAPMTEYEIYSYEAFRKKYQDDIRVIDRAQLHLLDKEALDDYLDKLREGKPHLSKLSDEEIYELMSVTRNQHVTLSAAILFSPYPQAYFPQMCITAVVIPGTETGDCGESGERFLDNQRIEGTIPQMLETAIQFVKKNMRKKTIINPDTGKREDRWDYPITAVREAILNALVHRDYSIYTQGMPIQILMYEDRMEIHSPGGVYGRIRIDQLGKVQPDTRNPVLAVALEVLGITENRYSGIPTIQRSMIEYGLKPAEFAEERGTFVVRFYKESCVTKENKLALTEEEKLLLEFCEKPRNRKEICDYLGLTSTTYAIQTYVMPLVERGYIKLSIPDKPKSSKQLYTTVQTMSMLVEVVGGKLPIDYAIDINM